MFLYNGKKHNIDSPITLENGTFFSNIRDPKVRELAGIVEVPDPIYPDPELYYWSEKEDGSLDITPKSEEQLAQVRMSKAKQQRSIDIQNIIVTTASGKCFNGDEVAQGRMSRAITVMDSTDSMPWVLSNNSIEVITRTELMEALKLAGVAMAEIWVKPYAVS